MNLRLKNLLLGFVFFILMVFPLAAQQYFINSFTYEIDGITKEYALNYVTGLYEGEIISDLSALELFIQDKTQILINERVFESVSIEYTIRDILPDGRYPVDLVIYLKDTWNFIALPYPKYDDNSGLSVTLKARNYNFLGTMSVLRLDLGYQYDKNDNTVFSFMLDTGIPFKALGIYWDIDFDHDLLYRADFTLPWYYKNTTGISIELPVDRTTVKIGFVESIILNEENSSEWHTQYGQFQEGLYLSSKPYVRFNVPTGLNVFNLGELVYTPQISAVFNHELPSWSLAEFRKGPFLYFTHSFSFGRIDWIGNFRKGMSLNLDNSISYNFYNLWENLEPLGISVSFTTVNHYIISDFTGLSLRFMYRQSFLGGSVGNAGNVLRGVLDSSVSADDFILSLNIDVPIRILRIRPSQWSENNKFLSLFDFDLHMVPILDMAFYPYTIYMAGGMELIIFPHKWRSLFLRVSLGIGMQLTNPAAGITKELFIGMELCY